MSEGNRSSKIREIIHDAPAYSHALHVCTPAPRPRLVSKNITIHNHLWSYSLGWVAHPRSQRMNQQRWVSAWGGESCTSMDIVCSRKRLLCIWYFSVTKMGLFRLSLALSFSLCSSSRLCLPLCGVRTLARTCVIEQRYTSPPLT